MEIRMDDCVRINADTIINNSGFNYDTCLSLVITNVDETNILKVKKILIDILGIEQDIEFNNETIKVGELRKGSGIIVCKPLDFKSKQRFNFIDLYRIFKVLRSENGCEWDKAQTHESIRKNTIEEAYELVEAINNYDVDNMREECGDVILQSIFHSVIAEETEEFNVIDVITTLCKKLITRHTHIFGDDKATNAQDALIFWDKAKSKEKKYDSVSDKLDGIARALPSLMKANKILNVAKKLDLDLTELDKDEKVINLCLSLNSERDFGKVLLKIIKIANESGFDAETALSSFLDTLLFRIKTSESMEGDIKENFKKLGE